MTEDRLDGWKAIASHLQKSVRTAQRWEAEYGLPVRRVGRQGGEIIWASRAELDAWWRASELNAHDEGARAQQAATPRLRRRWQATAAAMALAVASALALSSVSLRDRVAGSPARATVDPGAFNVFDSNDRRLFTAAIPFLRQDDFKGAVTGRPGSWAQFADLDDDGSMEVIFLALSSEFDSGMALMAFNMDGSKRFTIRPSHKVQFGQKLYGGPWRPNRMLVAANGRAGRSVFVSFIGPLEFPTLVIEVDSGGTVLAEYWSNGYVQTMHLVEWRGTRTLFVGATHNDSRGASLALFPGGTMSGSAPATRDAYRCLGCPPGGPAEFYLFPRRRLAAAIDGQATVQDIRVSQADQLHVNVGEGPANPDGMFPHSLWYTIGSTQTPVDALVPSGVVAFHNRLVSEGLLPERFGASDERAAFPVQRWTGQRFEILPEGKVSY